MCSTLTKKERGKEKRRKLTEYYKKYCPSLMLMLLLFGRLKIKGIRKHCMTQRDSRRRTCMSNGIVRIKGTSQRQQNSTTACTVKKNQRVVVIIMSENERIV